MYSLQIKVWKTDDKYGEPDEVQQIGSYFSTEAAECDVKSIQLRLMLSGYERVVISIIDDIDKKEEENTG